MKEFKLKRTREYLEKKISSLEAEIVRLNSMIEILRQSNKDISPPYTPTPVDGTPYKIIYKGTFTADMLK